MQIFHCSCKTRPLLFFESVSCTVCERITGFSDWLGKVVAFDKTQNEELFTCEEDPETLYQRCQNSEVYGVCNGMVRLDAGIPDAKQPLVCFACQFNNMIPNLDVNENLSLWRKLEAAKRRALFTLVALDLPVRSKTKDPEGGLSFSFLADKQASDNFKTPLDNQEPVFTGHVNGEITINLAEADDIARTTTRIAMGEQYRTLLGHFRHETGHYYWDLLVAPNTQSAEEFKSVFGNNQLDYSSALDRYYQEGPPDNWQESYISAYATMHPWEDWAETWAHYLHIIDTLETAQAFGLRTESDQNSANDPAVSDLALPQTINLYAHQTPIDDILKAWIKFSVALNSVNRSMGLPDAYPFVLYPTIRNKIRLIHEIIHSNSAK